MNKFDQIFESIVNELALKADKMVRIDNYIDYLLKSTPFKRYYTAKRKNDGWDAKNKKLELYLINGDGRRNPSTINKEELNRSYIELNNTLKTELSSYGVKDVNMQYFKGLEGDRTEVPGFEIYL